MSSFFSGAISLSIFGQSHGAAIGMTLDGIPAGENIDLDALQKFLNKRAPGNFPWATSRKEDDRPEFLSGIVNGITCGAPITAVIHNRNTRSADYNEFADVPRPGHADFAAHVKYRGFQDISGGGHFSGRLTAALCIAGGICLQILARRGVDIGSHITLIEHITAEGFDPVNIDSSTFRELENLDFPALNQATAMIDIIDQARKAQDSVGGTIECAITGLPPGLGSPMFGGMENQIAQIIFAIPAIKGLEFGAGFDAAKMRGSTHNDAFCISGGTIKTRTNNHGGILGGITTGMPLVFRAAIKPTPSIGLPQESISLNEKTSKTLSIEGRHDPCIVPRAVPCITAAASIAALNAYIEFAENFSWLAMPTN